MQLQLGQQRNTRRTCLRAKQLSLKILQPISVLAVTPYTHSEDEIEGDTDRYSHNLRADMAQQHVENELL